MAEKLLRAGAKNTLANKRVRKIADSDSIVLVGTYKDKQLNWIKKNHYYCFKAYNDYLEYAAMFLFTKMGYFCK